MTHTSTAAVAAFVLAAFIGAPIGYALPWRRILARTLRPRPWCVIDYSNGRTISRHWSYEAARRAYLALAGSRLGAHRFDLVRDL